MEGMVGLLDVSDAFSEGGTGYRRIFAAYDGSGEEPLADLTAALLERQKEEWSDLSAGYAALDQVELREIRGAGWRAYVQFNPQRIASSEAKVDPQSIRQRPCFLCLAHLPPEQQAIRYREEYLILCNPMPILPGHLTIAHCLHLPQAISGNILILLTLAADFGLSMTLLYNGPRAGASAPDHLHFQAVPAGRLAVESEILDPGKRTLPRRREGVEIWRTEGLRRGVVAIEGAQKENVAAMASRFIGLLGDPEPSGEEPLLNLLCNRTERGWRLLFFPRRRHRPAAYDREGEARLLISPGAVDMGGMIIASREKEFRTLTSELLSDIFQEVATEDAALEALLDAF